MAETYMHQLVAYLKKNIVKGYPIESLKWALVKQGHSRSEVDKAIKFTTEQLALQAPKLVEKPVIKVETEPPIPKKQGLWQKIKSLFS